MEFSSDRGCDSLSGGSDHHDDSNPQVGGKNVIIDTRSIKFRNLNWMFKEGPHPDEKTRSLLSRGSGLHLPQMKFWSNIGGLFTKEVDN
ncbi:hypothetical protein CASFOL_022147 [Castilleja foliolosa]|uniref:Uncharacterized protein n=1 Tax=Castilleja foliolosa TaxID=1961234 RepID=A0ABD3CYK9_9LAMI